MGLFLTFSSIMAGDWFGVLFYGVATGLLLRPIVVVDQTWAMTYAPLFSAWFFGTLKNE